VRGVGIELDQISPQLLAGVVKSVPVKVLFKYEFSVFDNEDTVDILIFVPLDAIDEFTKLFLI
jgi:hypothetical protein